MSALQKVLRAEISRIARKEVRDEIESARKASVQHRRAIAELRKQLDALAREVRALRKASAKVEPPVSAVPSEEGGPPRRFSAGRLAAHRAKLGLSAAVYGKLIGVSGQSVTNWEQGTTRPRAAQLQALVAVRGLSRREADEHLARL